MENTNYQQDLSQGQDSSPDSALPITYFNVKLKHFANADAAANTEAAANADAGGSTIALPGLRPGKLKILP